MSQRSKKRVETSESESDDGKFVFCHQNFVNMHQTFVFLDMKDVIEQKHHINDDDGDEHIGLGKKSQSRSSSDISIVVATGPATQHRNVLLNRANEKIKNHLCKPPENGHHFDVKTKLALVNCIKNVNKRRTASCKIAVKNMDWTQVKIEGLNTDEAKDCLKQILAPVNAMRTLDEMLNDYLENYQKYELKKSLNAPKLPQNPVMRYVTEHRAEFEKKLKKKHPDERIQLVTFCTT